MWHVILDCYPAVGSDEFERTALAAVSCWIADTKATDADFALRVARDELGTHGWVVVDSIEIRRVDLSEDRSVAQQAFLHRANLNGMAFEFHLVARRLVPGHEKPKDLTLAYTSAITSLVNGAFTYLGPKGEQAWGYLDEEPFFALWTSSEAAARCSHQWPSCQLALIELDQLTDFLREQYADEERMVALGFEDDSMLMFHPLAIADAARARFSLTGS
jgi:hypothetical protein